MRFAKQLKKLRAEIGYTQQRLPEIIRVEDYKHIRRLENKDPPAVRIYTMGKIAKTFKIPLSRLINFDE